MGSQIPPDIGMRPCSLSPHNNEAMQEQGCAGDATDATEGVLQRSQCISGGDP